MEGQGQRVAVMMRTDKGETDTSVFSLDGSLDALSRNRARCREESVSAASETGSSDHGQGSGAAVDQSARSESERDRRQQMLEDFRFSLRGCVSVALPDARQLESWYATAEEAARELDRRIRVGYQCSIDSAKQRFKELQDLAERLGGRLTVSWTDEAVRNRLDVPSPYRARVAALRDDILEDLREARDRTEARFEEAKEIMEDFDERW